MLSEYDVVKNIAAMQGIPSGTDGTILMVDLDNDPPIYLIEFVDGDGNTLEIISASEDQLELIHPFDAKKNASC